MAAWARRLGVAVDWSLSLYCSCFDGVVMVRLDFLDI